MMNILVITIDQLRWDALACAGNKEIETPNIDRLGKEGVRFTHAFTNAPACMPARSSLLTGRFPHAHGVRGGGVRLSEQEVTFPQLLSQRGYHTAHIGKLHVQNHTYRDHTAPHPSYGYRTLQVTDERGTYRDPYTQWVERNHPEYADAIRIEPGMTRVRNQTDHLSGNGSFPAKASHSHWVSEASIEFLQEFGSSPFMLWSSFFDPHSPFIVPLDLLDRYDPNALSLPRNCEITAENEAMIRQKKAAYYTLVSHVDDCIGKLLDYLDESGLSERTAVMLSSDHGEFLGDWGRWGKGRSEDESIRIPMIVKAPNIKGGGRVVDDIVQLFDLAPTICDLTGSMKPHSMQARSLLPLLRGEEDPERAPFALIELNSEVSRIDTAEVFEKTLRNRDYRLTVWSNQEKGVLYDLRLDPLQLNNVWSDSSYQKIRDKLIWELLQRLIQTENTLPVRTNPF
ncbi:sulfatase-like hydrolase/transferase [Paenibacillus sp. LMG 31456]|uniref:Sulfatase-like hydrolase/transferase n=1 Tax=Paenibacillus foliorum TaxID=2654974 RepID=A0A972K1M0_9BACL|nr:sulfatase-like hydrolase/transferase [Paenibacillus foliorum]NOU95856.1 sulfatase-like hydrolase/transferase [Paenibacillus foliorum]